MNLVLFKRDELTEGSLLTVGGRRAEHLQSVLKVKPGDSIRVGELNGRLGTGQVVKIENGRITLQIELTTGPASGPAIDLIVALPRPQILKSVLHTAAMFGIRRIFLTRAARVQKSYFQSRVLEEDTTLQHLLLGLEQGVLTRVPQVTVVKRFRVLLEQYLGEGLSEELSFPRSRLVFHPDAAETLADLFLKKDVRFQGELGLAIGPEGGWQEYEVEELKNRGFRPCNIGPQVLRLDSALSSILGQVGLLRTLSA